MPPQQSAMSEVDDFVCPLMEEYLELVEDTEAPIMYHRWCFLTAVAGMLNRRTCIPMPTGTIYPNMFTVLLGPPGARKSTAISMAGKLVREAGYSHLATGKTSAEQFLVDLSQGYDAVRVTVRDLEMLEASALTAKLNHDIPEKCSHAMIEAGELQDFLGNSNLNFLYLLTNLWDNPADYPYRLKDNTNELLTNPTVSLIGGATQTTFKKTFPIEVVGQGLLSRFLLIHGSGARKRIFMPKPLCEERQSKIVEMLKAILRGGIVPKEYKLSPEAMEYSEALYNAGEGEITDPRFQHYANRRNTHYLKICMVLAAMNLDTEITLDVCIYANTILSYTEKFMPVALGEFGLDQSAEQVEYLYHIIKAAPDGLSMNALVERGLAMFKNPSEIAAHLVKLLAAGRIEKIVKGVHTYYIPITRKIVAQSKMVNYYLMKEYRENPTFDTAFEVSDEKKLEWELKMEQADMKAELKATRKQTKRSKDSIIL